MRIDKAWLEAHASEDVRELNPDLFAHTPSAVDPTPKRNKYNARRTEVDGIVFDSKKEAARYVALKLLEQQGVIQDLQRQVRYKLADAFVDSDGRKHRAIHYTADFVYTQDGATIIEDVKSVATQRTEGFRLRWKMLLKQFAHNEKVRCVVYD